MSPVSADYGPLPEPAFQALEELLARDDPTIIGIVLTGSAARGLATANSDVDVMVIRDSTNTTNTTNTPPLQVVRSSAIDEIPLPLAELETPKPIGSSGAWDRWSFAWATILRDTSPNRRVTSAVHR